MPKEIFGPDHAFLKRDELLSYEEMERLVRIFVGFGVEKVRITGGEPLVRRDLRALIGKLKRIDSLRDITLTTNGTLLRAQARSLRDAGLDRITVSLDSLDDEVFQAMNDVGAHVDAVLDGIDAAAEVGLSPIKINVVVQRGVNDHTLVELARRFRGTGHIVRFIEFMDVGNSNGWLLDNVVPASEIIRRIDAEFPLEPVDANYQGEVARRYRYRDGEGEIGLITSISQPFCGDCTRARLSPEGELYTCLFASGGTDLRTLLRASDDDQAVADAVASVWSRRDDRYSELRTSLTPNLPKVEMSHIGG
jgi:GTP 3',8-cyclase